MSTALSKIIMALLILSVSILTPAAALAAPPAQDGIDIVATAIAAGDFTTLVAAVEAAGLVETIQGEGPFTVFAPTDAAFAALPEGTVESLLQDPTGILKDILLYHVTTGEVLAVDVLNSIGGLVGMVNGRSAAITVSGNRVLIGTAGFVVTDIKASNGIIHVIDAVILPPTTAPDESLSEPNVPVEEPVVALPNIVETAVAAGSFTTLVAAVQAAGLVEALQGAGPFTVFAPTDDAFAALPAGTVEALLADPTGALKDILLYHVVPGKALAADVIALNNTAVTTVLGETVVVRVVDGVVMINESKVVTTDIETSNGVIHVIDAVLLPPAKEVVEDEPVTLQSCSTTYVVQHGDTLSKIAARYGVNTHALAQANGIQNLNIIYRGQSLCITH